MTEARQAMGDQRSRLGAANLSVPLMIVTFILVAGFLWWLNANSEPTQVVIQEREAPDVASPGAAATEVTEEDLRSAPERFEGQVVRVEELGVAMTVGRGREEDEPQAFFLDVTDAPFLVKLSEALVQQGQRVPQSRVIVVGTLRPMTDSIIQDWLQRGIASADNEILLEFATHFIEATSVQPVQPPMP